VSDGSLVFESYGKSSGLPAFSPSGTLLTFGGDLYRVSDSNLILSTAGHKAKFSPDGTLLLATHYGSYSGMDDAVWLYRVSDGSLVLEVKEPYVDDLTRFGLNSDFSPNSTLVAVGGSIYRTSDGSLAFEVEGNQPLFSPGGTLLATSADLYRVTDHDTGTVRLYRVSDGRLVLKAEGWDPVFSPDGTLLATTDYDTDTVRLYRVSDGSLLLEAKGRYYPCCPPQFSLDGTLLAMTTVSEESGYTVRLYRVSDGRLVLEVEGSPSQFSPDGTLLAIATDAGIELWGIAP
jgi:WD40 repeat protein